MTDASADDMDGLRERLRDIALDLRLAPSERMRAVLGAALDHAPALGEQVLGPIVDEIEALAAAEPPTGPYGVREALQAWEAGVLSTAQAIRWTGCDTPTWLVCAAHWCEVPLVRRRAEWVRSLASEEWESVMKVVSRAFYVDEL